MDKYELITNFQEVLDKVPNDVDIKKTLFCITENEGMYVFANPEADKIYSGALGEKCHGTSEAVVLAYSMLVKELLDNKPRKEAIKLAKDFLLKLVVETETKLKLIR